MHQCEPCKADALGRCSHIVAVLLMLLDHIKEHGPIVSTPCTGKDCTWNKDNKRHGSCLGGLESWLSFH